jgi:DNA-binding beta-propeller fold protein YncE
MRKLTIPPISSAVMPTSAVGMTQRAARGVRPKIGLDRGLISRFTALLALALTLICGCANSSTSSRAGAESGGMSASAAASVDPPSPAHRPATPVGNSPQFAVQNPKTLTLYVTNSGSNTVSVVNMATCNIRHPWGCAKHWPVVDVGSIPLGLAVDEATDTIYVSNAGDSTVSVINGATCNATNTSGCSHQPATVHAGAFADAVAVDPVTNTVFVTNQDASPGTVSVINGNSCNGRHPGGCANQPFATVRVGGGPSGIDVNPATKTIYVANTGEDSNNHPLPNGDSLSVINGATCNPNNKPGCAQVATVRVGAAPANVTVVPATNTLYVANTYDGTSSPTGTVSVVNGKACSAITPSGCRLQKPPQVPVGADPVSAAFDASSDTVYVPNENSGTLSLINAANCNAITITGCKDRPQAVAVGMKPAWAVVSSTLDTIYVVDGGDNNILLLRTGQTSA